jgi:modulator of FtsH protease
VAGAWHDFFVTAGGASAALVGLLFVALSIRVDEIRRNRIAYARASAAFRGLVTSLLVSLAVLVPGYPRVTSIAVAVAGGALFVIQARLAPSALIGAARRGVARPAMFIRAGVFQVAALAIVLAGISLLLNEQESIANLMLAGSCACLVFLALLNSYALVSRTEEQMESEVLP